MLVEAGQPEILRAAQRDDDFKKQLNENVSEILLSVFGIRNWIKYKESAERFSNVLYQVMTTMLNIQTLGEEYAGMVQVDSSKRALPKKHVQLLMILLKTYGEKALTKTLLNLDKRIERSPKEQLDQSTKLRLKKIINNVITWTPIISKLHLVLFYLKGHYYEIPNRICGVKYALVRYWLKDRSSIVAFKLLGLVTLIQLIASSLITGFNHNMGQYVDNVIESTSSHGVIDSCDKCSLCLNLRQNTSVTPCGHLFCWSCIIPWLQEQARCPLCRHNFQPSRVVFLQNYSTYC